MRRRNMMVTIRLTKEEFAFLNEQVAKTGYSKESYLRSLIHGNVPNEAPPIAYHKLMQALKSIGNNMNQIAVKAHVLNVIDADSYNQNMKALYGVIQEIQQAVLLPKEVKDGNHKGMEDQR